MCWVSFCRAFWQAWLFGWLSILCLAQKGFDRWMCFQQLFYNHWLEVACHVLMCLPGDALGLLLQYPLAGVVILRHSFWSSCYGMRWPGSYVVLLSGSYSPGAFCGHLFFMGSHRERTCMKCFGTMKAFVEQLAMLTAMFP